MLVDLVRHDDATTGGQFVDADRNDGLISS